MFADEGPNGIGAGVAELGDEHEIDEKEFALNMGEIIDFLDEIHEPGDVHESK